MGVVACVVLSNMLEATELHIYMFHATQLHALVLFVSCTDGVGGGRGCMRRLVTHVGCYRTAHVSRYATCARTVRIMHGWGGGWGGGGVGVVACVVLSHMLDATELHIHVSCYATAFAHTCTHANSDFPRGALMASESLSELLHGTFFFRPAAQMPSLAPKACLSICYVILLRLCRYPFSQ